MAVGGISCCALFLGVVSLLGVVEAEPSVDGTWTYPKGPRNCDDVLLGGDLTEGYYAGYPDLKNPEMVGLLYCGVKDGMMPRNSSGPRSDPKNCRDLLDGGMTDSGINVIYPYASSPDIPVVVYCEQTVAGGGWTVFQHRREMTTQENFYRTFDEYAVGFGNVGSEFWLGNDIINEITSQSANELYVDLTDFDGVNKYARYNYFYVGPRDYDPSYWPYQLSVGMYSGTAGDAMTGNSGIGFSASDYDNDDWDDHDCVNDYRKGGWWFKDSRHNYCGHSNPNGLYGNVESGGSHIYWEYFDGTADQSYHTLQTVMLMTRPLIQQ